MATIVQSCSKIADRIAQIYGSHILQFYLHITYTTRPTR
jgi:hypothetical protein